MKTLQKTIRQYKKEINTAHFRPQIAIQSGINECWVSRKLISITGKQVDSANL